MTTASTQIPVIWRISDGKAGHDSQSKGLVKALNLIKHCDCHDIKLTERRFGLLDLIFKRAPATKSLPDPDMIIGAGHETHLPLLCAKRARGGKTVLLMSPSISVSCFDFCFIPEHDTPKISDNVFTTKGTINCISPSSELAPNRGLILIGGASRHFHWDDVYLLQQLNEILTTYTNITWEISDSSRTPPRTRKLLATLQQPNGEYKNYSKTDSNWIAERLNFVANVWVSMDSVSMVYESLSSGAAVGLLDVPIRSTNKISKNITELVADKIVTPYNEWLSERKLKRPLVILNEASRCAERLHEAGLLH